MFFRCLSSIWSTVHPYACRMSQRSFTTSLSQKPPNIYIKTKDSEAFHRVHTAIMSVLKEDHYTIYQLELPMEEKLVWKDHTKLFIWHDESPLNLSTCKPAFQFWKEGGNVLLSLCSSQNEKRVIWRDEEMHLSYLPSTGLGNFEFLKDTEVYGRSDSGEAVIWISKSNDTHGNIAMSTVNLFCEGTDNSLQTLKSIMRETFNLNCKDSITADHAFSKESYLHVLRGEFNSLELIKSNLYMEAGKQLLRGSETLTVEGSEVIVSDGAPSFESQVFLNSLKKSEMFKTVIYCDVISSTMDFLKLYPLEHGTIIIAGQQTKGKGRGGNIWLSPKGCAMFSLQFCIKRESFFWTYVSFIQHLMALASIKAILSKPGYEELPFKLKWPNDIYSGRDTKLGGVIVNTTLNGKIMVVSIGCGINVSNDHPTDCINSLIHRNAPKLQPISNEEFIARCLNCFEELMTACESGHVEAIRQEYYKYWLHGQDRVKVILSKSSSIKEMEICGIDLYGFLVVKDLSSGEEMTVHPDGNSFDLLHGLIAPKA